MIPNKSFIIWFTPRTGSTLLCKSLEETCVAGKAGEFFNIGEDESLLSHYKKDDYVSLKNHLWSLGCSSNGVMGLKHSLFRQSYERLSREVMSLRDLKDINKSDWVSWDDLFPDCQHIFLTRRNKIRRVVSWLKAIVDGQWHLNKGQFSTRSRAFYAGKYDLAALVHLLKEHNLRESATQEFFIRNDIIPRTIVYEDFIANYQETIRGILTFINVAASVSVHEMFYNQTADDVSEEWVQRFRHDLQKDWEKLIW